MGAVQRLATMVIVGLVALSTILVLYLADENNRITAKEEEQKEAAIERATAKYISLCIACHGPAGEGYTEGTGRVGAALGGINTSVNQQGVNAQGTPVAGGVDGRTAYLTKTIHNGLLNSDGKTYRMPAWGAENNGPLNDAQIEELVIMIQNVDWNLVYNEAIAASGGYPTVPPTAAPATTTTATATAEAGTYSIALQDVKFGTAELTVPANTDITINLTNEGGAAHNFNIDELNVHSGDIAGGATGSVTFNTGAPGEYTFYCSIPGHKEAGMVGKLIVSDQAAAPAAEATTSTSTTGGGTAAVAPIDVAMQDISFSAKEITISANTDVTFNLVNNGAATHNFTIVDTDFTSGDYVGGQTGTLVVNLPPGEYIYECTIPGHKEAGMTGKLIVQ